MNSLSLVPINSFNWKFRFPVVHDAESWFPISSCSALTLIIGSYIIRPPINGYYWGKQESYASEPQFSHERNLDSCIILWAIKYIACHCSSVWNYRNWRRIMTSLYFQILEMIISFVILNTVRYYYFIVNMEFNFL